MSKSRQEDKFNQIQLKESISQCATSKECLAAKKKGRGKPIDRLDIACSNRIALPKSVLKTCSQAWQEPSQDFQNSRPKLSQMWPEPYKSIQIRGTFWIVGTFSKRFKSLRNYIEATPQWHSKAAKKTLTSSPKMGKLGQSPHVSNDENTSIYPKHQRASFAFEP